MVCGQRDGTLFRPLVRHKQDRILGTGWLESACGRRCRWRLRKSSHRAELEYSNQVARATRVQRRSCARTRLTDAFDPSFSHPTASL